jgi:hypothetical protein
MTIYQDDIITFEIPFSLPRKSVKKDLCSWSVFSKKLDFSIVVDFAKEKYHRSNIKIFPKNIDQWYIYNSSVFQYDKGPHKITFDEIVPVCRYDDSHKMVINDKQNRVSHYDGPHKIVINNNEICYSFLISEVIGEVGLFVPSCDLAINHDKYVICIDISIGRTKTCSFPLEDFMPFISSINIHDFDKLKRKFDDITQRDIKKYSKPPVALPVNIPQGFTEISSITPNGRSLKKDNFEIHVIDLTGLGREADIDIFKEASQEGEKIEDARLWKLRGKRCLIQNLEGTPLDFSSCKNIEILLAFCGKCYSVLMKNDTPFDLNKYQIFLNSVGVKTKKSVTLHE